jgi:signal transduction histidine kinase
VNLLEVLMGAAVGIGVLAALSQGLVGFSRRPRDRATIAFAGAAAASAVAALAVIAMYSAGSIGVYVSVAKWVFFPASAAWTVAIVWFVAFRTGVRPLRFLLALTAGFAAAAALDLALPHGLLYDEMGSLDSASIGSVTLRITVGSSPHILDYAADALTLIAFAYLCYAVYRALRRRAPDARYLAVMVALLGVATLLDTINDHSVITAFTTLYVTQLCFAAIILAVSVALRRESLSVETELRMYRTQMDSLVDARVYDLDQANARLALEARERRATEETLRLRVAELGAMQQIAQTLSGRSELREALDDAARAIEGLFKARYARVHLLTEEGSTDDAVRPATGSAAPATGAGPRSLTFLDAAASRQAIRKGKTFATEAPDWPGLPGAAGKRAAAADVGHLLAVPLVGASGAVGALVVARSAAGGGFSGSERRLVASVADAVTGVIEIDRLHRRETREAAEEERQALARDLHDAVTQSVYSASLIAEALPSVWERDPDEGLRNLERLRRLVRAALAEMRTLLFELRPAALEAAPLDTLLDRLGDSLGGQVQIPVEIVVKDGVDLPGDVKLAFYRVTQEAFSNVIKHARATRVTVEVSADGEGATLTVRDDGKGFDPDTVASGHMGLHIMRERLERVQAALVVDSAPGKGTTLRAVWASPAPAAASQGGEGS